MKFRAAWKVWGIKNWQFSSRIFLRFEDANAYWHQFKGCLYAGMTDIHVIDEGTPHDIL